MFPDSLRAEAGDDTRRDRENIPSDQREGQADRGASIAQNVTSSASPLPLPGSLAPEFKIAPKRDLIAEATAIREAIDAEAANIAAAAMLANEIEDDEILQDEEGRITRIAPPMPAGWTKKQFRTARDARRSTKDAPVYLKMAADRDMTNSRRLDGDRNININVMVVKIPDGDTSEPERIKIVDVEGGSRRG